MEGCYGCKIKNRSAGCYPYRMSKQNKIHYTNDCPCAECIVKIICTTSCKVRIAFFKVFHRRLFEPPE